MEIHIFCEIPVTNIFFFSHTGRFFCTKIVFSDDNSHVLRVFDGLFVGFCEKAPPSWGHPGASVDAFGRKS